MARPIALAGRTMVQSIEVAESLMVRRGRHETAFHTPLWGTQERPRKLLPIIRGHHTLPNSLIMWGNLKSDEGRGLTVPTSLLGGLQQ